MTAREHGGAGAEFKRHWPHKPQSTHSHAQAIVKGCPCTWGGGTKVHGGWIQSQSGGLQK